MRIHIGLDPALLDRALQLTGLPTKEAAIHEALQLLIEIREQEPIRTLRGQLHWEGDLHALREERSGHVLHRGRTGGRR